MKRLLIILIALVTTDMALACQCHPMTFEQEVQVSNSIFHGRVLSVDLYTFDIEIIRTWKGEFTTKTFHLIQGETSCERRTFELNKEYLFYLRGKTVFNCSRTDEYGLTMDSELLDLKFNGIGDKKSIDSNTLTDREIDILKSLLKSKNINSGDIGRDVLFAIQDELVNKWTFFDSYRWSDLEVKLIKLDKGINAGQGMLWIGTKWDKSLKKLKKVT